MFGRATIRLGIGPHSSLVSELRFLSVCWSLNTVDCRWFIDINISHGSVATHFRCGRMFSDNFVANLLLNQLAKKSANRSANGDVTSCLFDSHCTSPIGGVYIILGVFTRYHIWSFSTITLQYCIHRTTKYWPGDILCSIVHAFTAYFYVTLFTVCI